MCRWRTRRRWNSKGADVAAVAVADDATDDPMVRGTSKETVVEMQQMRSLLSLSMKSDASGGGGAGEDGKESEIIIRNHALSPGTGMVRMNQLEQLVMQQQLELSELRGQQNELKDLRTLVQSLLTK